MGSRQFGYIRTLKSGRFKASYLDPTDKRRRYYSVELFYTRELAQKWLLDVWADMLKGTWKPPEPPREDISLHEYALGWLGQRKADLKESTLDLYAEKLDKFILPLIGNATLGSLRPLLVKEWYAKVGTMTGPTSQAQSYRILRTILNEAVRDELIPSNPCMVRGGGQDKHQERVPIAIHEIPVLADGFPDRYKTLIHVAALSGLREGELLELRRRDVLMDQDGVALRVSRSVQRIKGKRLKGKWVVSDPKTQAGNRIVSLPPHLAPILEEHMSRFVGDSPDALVFGTSTGNYLSVGNLSAMLRRARVALGRPDLHFHDLRHTAATLAAQTGATTKEVMVRIGHASPAAANIYQHATRGRDAEIADKLTAMVAEQGNVVPIRRNQASKADQGRKVA